MKHDWTADELLEHWTLPPGERRLLANKCGATRLGFAVLLKFFQHEGRFPRRRQDVPRVVLEYIASQIYVAPLEWADYDSDGRAIKYHRAQIREFLGFREATFEDSEVLVACLDEHVLPDEQHLEHLHEKVLDRCRALRLEPPTPERIDRLVRSALHAFEKRFCTATLKRLSPQTHERLQELLIPDLSSTSSAHPDPEHGRAAIIELFADSGPPGLKSVLEEVAKLDRVRSLGLPSNLFEGISSQVIQSYRQRPAVEAPYELRRMFRGRYR